MARQQRLHVGVGVRPGGTNDNGHQSRRSRPELDELRQRPLQQFEWGERQSDAHGLCAQRHHDALVGQQRRTTDGHRPRPALEQHRHGCGRPVHDARRQRHQQFSRQQSDRSSPLRLVDRLQQQTARNRSRSLLGQCQPGRDGPVHQQRRHQSVGEQQHRSSSLRLVDRLQQPAARNGSRRSLEQRRPRRHRAVHRQRQHQLPGDQHGRSSPLRLVDQQRHAAGNRPWSRLVQHPARRRRPLRQPHQQYANAGDEYGRPSPLRMVDHSARPAHRHRSRARLEQCCSCSATAITTTAARSTNCWCATPSTVTFTSGGSPTIS
jgi:hypothetical protein